MAHLLGQSRLCGSQELLLPPLSWLLHLFVTGSLGITKAWFVLSLGNRNDPSLAFVFSNSVCRHYQKERGKNHLQKSLSLENKAVHCIFSFVVFARSYVLISVRSKCKISSCVILAFFIYKESFIHIKRTQTQLLPMSPAQSFWETLQWATNSLRGIQNV